MSQHRFKRFSYYSSLGQRHWLLCINFERAGVNVKNNEPENIVTGAPDVIVGRVIDDREPLNNHWSLHIVVDPGPLWSWKGDFSTSSHHTMAVVSANCLGTVMEWWLWAAPHCRILQAGLSLQWGSQDCVSATKSCIRLLRTHSAQNSHMDCIIN